MTVLLARVLTTLHLEDDDLLTLNERLYNFTYYLCSFYSWSTYCDSTVVIYEQYLLSNSTV